ncbi:[FeFe] hydrogenase H-cluster maturation GTPase HydF [Natronospora cellulosivora (SeqCode)]
MNNTPQGNRPHIAVFGRRNTGKSSLINVLSNQELAVVSDLAGTTTDPVYKSIELLPFGPVLLIDTAGIDDYGSIGEMRVRKTNEVLRKTDLALLVIDPEIGIGSYEKKLIEKLESKSINILLVINKADLFKNFDINESSNFSIRNLEKIKQHIILNCSEKDKYSKYLKKGIIVSALDKKGIDILKDEIIKNIPVDYEERTIIGDLINPGDTIVLVTPIDSAAPKGRLILPQVQTIRDIIDHDGIAMVTKENELEKTLANLREKARMVITDSQAFAKVNSIVPKDIYLTGFSVLFARYKGDLGIFLKGAKKLENLKRDAKILIAEACTHRRQQDDIGTVKIPKWLRKKFGADLSFEHVSGREYPANLEEYDLILHCGGCMLNRKEVLYRLQEAEAKGVPVINYGMAIASLHGILDRALEPFSEISPEWKK